ncbi:MAG: IS66 family insertion sequence element accessory protein TnpB [Pseudomonadales bacterium]|nr:IS66 family insertion sequence element accessory protein TnpB [Pseudomonadales bacterium]
MIHLTEKTEIFIATNPVDFRKQIDGLVSLCTEHLHKNTRNGALYVFINRANTMIRILHHDGSGYWLATKRLSQGRYQGWPKSKAPISSAAASRLRFLIKSNTCQSLKV